MKIEKKRSLDGSDTLYLPDMDEHYHSVHGAFTESIHVYIDTAYRACTREEITVFEVGFGTGLNAVLTLIEAEKRQVPTLYYTVEKYPLPHDIVESLDYAAVIAPADEVHFRAIHDCAWGCAVQISEWFTIYKVEGGLIDCLLPSPCDVVYYDAFAPDKQPEMWEKSHFERLYNVMSPQAILSTYCAKGSVRRMWQEIGFAVERLAGPPGKREILRGRKV